MKMNAGYDCLIKYKLGQKPGVISEIHRIYRDSELGELDFLKTESGFLRVRGAEQVIEHLAVLLDQRAADLLEPCGILGHGKIGIFSLESLQKLFKGKKGLQKGVEIND